MGKPDNRVDEYITNSAAFAQPILKHLRKIIHQACPDIEETIKWGFPHFAYKGTVCSMASFKQHCAFGFWKASLISDPHKILVTVGKTAMGHLGQIKDIKDLPPDGILIQYLNEASKLNKEGIKLPARITDKKELKVPAYFMEALSENKKAINTFEGFSYTNKKEYVEWVEGAKTEDTRNKRLETAMDWMAEGKIRNWKYVK